jgi:hypothetical protein
MRTILLILLLSISALGCPQVVRTLYGRVMHDSRPVSMMNLQLTGLTTSFNGRTTQFGYYRIEVTGCDSTFVFSGTSKNYQFATMVVMKQVEQEMNIFIP